MKSADPAREPLYQALFTASLDAMVISALDGRILAANPAACRLLDRDEEEILRMGRGAMVDPSDPQVDQALAIRRRTGRFQGELTFVRKGGERFPVEVSTVVFQELGQADQTVVIFRDITERKRTELQLRLSEEKFARAFYTSPDAITVTRRSDGCYVEVNAGFTAVSGYTPEEVLGRSPVDLKIWLKQDQRDAFIRELDEKGEVNNLEVDFEFKGGRVKTTLVSARPIQIDGLPCLLSTTRDITDRKRLEESMLRTQKLESIGLLAGGIAHDFNNMLGSLLGFIELAREAAKQAGAEKAGGYLDRALGIYDRARGLTRQLLTFSKGGDPVRRPLPLGPLIRSSATFALSGSNVVAKFDLDDNLWLCDGDEDQIGQVVDNLVLNAVQSMSGGGTVTVSARNVPQAVGHEGRYAQISVADDGPGIEPANLTRIFDPFFTTKETGHGLGLATVFSIVRRHGGWVEASSVPGSGALFSFYLPATESAAPAPPEAPVSPEHRGQGRILVVDDDPSLLEVERQWLESMGYEVDTCQDAASGLLMGEMATFEGRPYSAAVLDLTIPGGPGGIELARWLRARDPGMVLIAATGYSEAAVVARPQEFGFAAKLVKPFRKEDLNKLMGELFSS